MKLLALDTSGDSSFIGVQHGELQICEVHAGGAHASATLIGACLALLGRAGLSLHALDAIAFGNGPGSFTGLRTACAVAQGFALGANKPVIAVPTLLAIGMDAHLRLGHTQLRVAMDARMSEVYVACVRVKDGQAWIEGEARAMKPSTLLPNAGETLVGNAHRVYADHLPDAIQGEEAAPTGPALLACATQLWRQGAATDAALAQPQYVRNQVALTEAERLAAKQALAA